MKYKTMNEIFDLIEKFENGTIEREKWGHIEHLIVAYHYCSNNDFGTALEKMREGIFQILKSFDIDLNKEMPYHETLTVFWIKSIYEFSEENSNELKIEILNKMIEKFDKNYPLKFYSQEHLFSDIAKATFIIGDKK